MIKRLILISLLLFSFSAFSQSSAFIYGGGNLCDNAGTIDVEISLTGTPPWNIVYAINGVSQPSISTSSNLHIIPIKTGGVYTVVSVSDAVGVGTTSGSAIVTILQAPIAQFTIEQDTLSILFGSSTQFQDKTIGATTWSWNFGDNTQNPFHTFDSIVAVYQVALIAGDINNCSDTTFHQVWVNDEYYIYIPNAFSPDFNGINDKFCIEFHGIRESTFLFKVFNPIGDIVFQSNNPNDLRCSINGGWDGTHYLTGESLPVIDPVTENSYVFTFHYRDFEGWTYNENGTIMLLRK